MKQYKKPWPTKAAMQQVYANKLWGHNYTNFYSGEGSHNPELVAPYIHAVSGFLASFSEPLVVCDLGCGDFNIGKQLVSYTKKYIAIDIVPELIEYNTKTFKQDHLEFQCMDIALDDLPSADCIILRQVLQHLSNQEIKQIVNKLSAYKYIILTEHLPEGDFVPNRDIISGQGIRLKKQSGVDLLAEPFNLKIKEVKQFVSVSLGNGKGEIVTSLFKVFLKK